MIHSPSLSLWHECRSESPDDSDITDPSREAGKVKCCVHNHWILSLRGIIFLSRSSLQYATEDICFKLHQLTRDKDKGGNLYSEKAIATGLDLVNPVFIMSCRICYIPVNMMIPLTKRPWAYVIIFWRTWSKILKTASPHMKIKWWNVIQMSEIQAYSFQFIHFFYSDLQHSP